MTSATPPLLHLVGYLAGASLYAMLLAMVVRTRGPAYRLTLGTALLGLAWNVGELAAEGLERVGLTVAHDWMSAVSYAALGFLAAVTVHSAGRGQADDDVPPARGPATLIGRGGYACAAAGGALQLFAAATGQTVPLPSGLVLVTGGLALLAPALLITTRRQPHGRRALWMTALAIFAVSALHLGQFHGATEGVWTELLGHHASIPLAFAILYQDYRFAFADLFLKRALTLLALVAIVFVEWTWLEPAVLGGAVDSPAIGVLLAVWIGTTLLFPWLHGRVSAFVDHVVLKRPNYSATVEGFASLLQGCETEEAVLISTCEAVGAALNTKSVAPTHEPAQARTNAQDILIPTTEAPQPAIVVGRLAGGRRLLSDDTLMLERVTQLAGRRIDALRLAEERYARMLREREISALAVEAELRALRAQINPHFLFNALTTLGYLIQHAPARALDTLMRLTTLLRSVLRSEGEFTTLGHERELIECYLQIERERFEERLDASVLIPDALTALTIPSLIVQPLVENAIKHGIAHVRDGGRVVVTAQVRNEASGRVLMIRVVNTRAHVRPLPSGNGIGLGNVERRLHGYYGDAASLTLTTAENGDTVAELLLPARDVDAREATSRMRRVGP